MGNIIIAIKKEVEYLPSNGTIVNFVLCNVDLNCSIFNVENFNDGK